MPTKLEANASFRKPRLVFLVLALALIFSVVFVGGVSAWSADTTWGQNYDDENVLEFYIEDAGDLAQFASMVNSGKDFSGRKVILNNNIDLQNQVWTPIGTSSTKPFRGTFDGHGYIIDNLNLSSSSYTVLGLFGYVDSGDIQNINVARSKFNPTSNSKTYCIGSIVGWLNDGFISNCSVLIKIDVVTDNNAGHQSSSGTRW